MSTLDSLEQAPPKLKSPLRKLMPFFRRSRDQWKTKYQALKMQCKLMGNQARAVEKSREKWAQEAKQARQQILHLQRQLEQYKKSRAA